MIIASRYTTVLSRILPERSIGGFAIKKATLSKGTFIRTYYPGGYFYHDKLNRDFPTVRLTEEKGGVWMSDTPMEQEALRIPSIIARGDVLIIGLGLGLLPTLIKTRNEMVDTILIIERSPEVANLVYDKIKSRKTSLLLGDGEAYLAALGRKFDFIFIDVWGSIIQPMKDIEHWTSLAKGRLKEDGEVRCWLQELYDRIKAKLPKEPVLEPGFPAVYDPCLVCGKKLRNDYAGLCMDCADDLGVSELYGHEGGFTLDDKGIRR